MMQRPESWGPWELLGVGPALVGIGVPWPYKNHPLCSRAGSRNRLAAGQQLSSLLAVGPLPANSSALSFSFGAYQGGRR